MSKEAKVGIFVLVGLVFLTYFTFKVSKWGGIVEKGYVVTADFENASGLEPKAGVKMAGVPIGRVEEIQLAGNRAHLILRIRDGIKIPADSAASIQTQGLLGEKYVEIIPGKAARVLTDGTRIAETVPPANLDEIVKKVSLIADDVKRLTGSLADSIGTPEGKQALADIIKNVQETSIVLRRVMASNEGRLDNIIANVDVLSRDLKDIASANKEDVRTAIANIRAFSQTLKDEAPELAKKLEKMGEGVGQLVSDNRENIKEGIASFRNAAAKLDNTLDSANKVMGRIERGEGTIGKLVNDNSTVASINSTLEGINRYVRKTESLKTYLDYHFEYLTDSSDFKHYAHLTLQPAADKYYQIGIVDDPRGKFNEVELTTTTTPPGTTTTTTMQSFERKLKFDAILAKRFWGLTVRAGVLESTGGFGLDYAFLGDRLKVSADAFDFNRPNNKAAHLKLYGSYDIVKNLFVTGGVDDLLNSDKGFRTFFLGLGVKFLDEDIKTVIGAVPIKP